MQRKQTATPYLACVGKHPPHMHTHTSVLYSPVNSTLEANRAIYIHVFRLRVTLTLHPAILMTGTLFKPTTGEWQQTMTECLFSIVGAAKDETPFSAKAVSK